MYSANEIFIPSHIILDLHGQVEKNNKPYLYLLSLEWAQDIFLLTLSFQQNINYIRSYPLCKQSHQHGNKHGSTILVVF